MNSQTFPHALPLRFACLREYRCVVRSRRYTVAEFSQARSRRMREACVLGYAKRFRTSFAFYATSSKFELRGPPDFVAATHFATCNIGRCYRECIKGSRIISALINKSAITTHRLHPSRQLVSRLQLRFAFSCNHKYIRPFLISEYKNVPSFFLERYYTNEDEDRGLP